MQSIIPRVKVYQKLMTQFIYNRINHIAGNGMRFNNHPTLRNQVNNPHEQEHVQNTALAIKYTHKQNGNGEETVSNGKTETSGRKQTLNARIRGAGKRFSVSSSANVLHAAKAAALFPS